MPADEGDVDEDLEPEPAQREEVPEADVEEVTAEEAAEEDAALAEIEAEADPEPAGQPSAPKAAAPQHEMSDQDARNWAVIAHLSGLLWLFSIPGLVGPLVVWLVHQGKHPLVEKNAKEALNFHLSLLIYAVGAGAVAVALILTIVGILLLPILALAAIAFLVLAVVLPIVAALKTSNGQAYRYPLTIRLVS